MIQLPVGKSVPTPPPDTLASYRKRILQELEGIFVEILMIVQVMGRVKPGQVRLDGTRIKASASKHKALSWAYANKREVQLQAAVKALLRLAEEADKTTLPEERDIPDELKRREAR